MFREGRRVFGRKGTTLPALVAWAACTCGSIVALEVKGHGGDCSWKLGAQSLSQNNGQRSYKQLACCLLFGGRGANIHHWIHCECTKSQPEFLIRLHQESSRISQTA
jgi:hypothetical protein